MAARTARGQSASFLPDAGSRTCGAASTTTPIGALNQLRRQNYALGKSQFGVEKSSCPSQSPYDAGAQHAYYINGLKIYSVQGRSKSVGMTPFEHQAESTTPVAKQLEPADTENLPAEQGQDLPVGHSHDVDDVVVSGRKLKYPHCRQYFHAEKDTPILPPLVDNAAARLYPASCPDSAYFLGPDTAVTGRGLEAPRCHTTSPSYSQSPLNINFEILRRHSRSLTSNLFTKGRQVKRRPTLMQERLNFYFAGRPVVSPNCYFCKVADRYSLSRQKFPGYPGYPGCEQHPYKRDSLQGQRSSRRLKGQKTDDDWFSKHSPRESVTWAMDDDRSESWVQTRHGINAFDLNVRFDEMTDQHGRNADNMDMPEYYPKINVTITNTRTGQTSQTPLSVYGLKEGSLRAPSQPSGHKPDLPWLNTAATSDWAPSEYELRQCLSDIWPFPDDFRSHLEEIRDFYCDEALLLERGRVTKIRVRKSPIYQLYRKRTLLEPSAEETDGQAQLDETMATTLTLPARDIKDCKQWISFNTNDEPSIHEYSDIDHESDISQRTKLFSADSGKYTNAFNTNDEPSIHEYSDIDNESDISQRTKLFSADSGKYTNAFNTNDEPSIHEYSDIDNESDISQRTKLFSADSDPSVPKQHLCFEPVVDKRYNKWKRRSRKKKESDRRRDKSQADNDSADEGKERCSSVERIIDSMYTKIHGPVTGTPNGTSETPRMRNRRRREQQAAGTDSSREPSETTSAESVVQKHTSVQCSWPFIEQDDIIERLHQSSDTPLDKSQQEWSPRNVNPAAGSLAIGPAGIAEMGATAMGSTAMGPATMGITGTGQGGIGLTGMAPVKEYSMRYTSGTPTSEGGRAGPKLNKSQMIPSAVGIIDLTAAAKGHPQIKTTNKLLRPDYESLQRPKKDNSSLPGVPKSPKSQTFPIANTKTQSEKDLASAKNKPNIFDFKEKHQKAQQPAEKSQHTKMDTTASQEAPSFLFRDYYLRSLYSKTGSSHKDSKARRKTIAVGPGAQSIKRRLSAEDRLSDRVPDNLNFTRPFTFSMFELPGLHRDYNEELTQRTVHKTS